MAHTMDTTPDVTPNGAAGAGVVHNPFADARGRLRGVVLWYNVTLKFGFIVPEDPNAPVLRVNKGTITAESDADDVQALQTNQIVHFTLSPDGVSAVAVTDTNEAGVNFSKKLDPPAAEREARKLLMPHTAPQQYPPHPMYGFYPPPHGAVAPPQAKKRKKTPSLAVNEDKIIYGQIMSWHAREGWGHVMPDEQPTESLNSGEATAVKEEAGASSSQANGTSSSTSSSSSSAEKKEAGATDADGDTAMNGDADEKPKLKVAPIVAELDQIETAPDRLAGLNVKSRVQFRVAKGPFPDTVTAVKVRNEDGSLIEYSTGFMQKCKKKEPIDDTVHKGTVAFFFKGFKRPYGFIKPEGTTEKKDHVFCHIVETNFMPLKQGAEVEYKLAEPDTEGKNKPACCVTGLGGAMAEYLRPKKRARPTSQPPPAAAGPPPSAGAPGWTFAPSAGGLGYQAFPPPGAGAWGAPPADFYGAPDAYGSPDYSWPPSNNYQVPWGKSVRRRSGNFNNKKRKKSGGSSNAVVAAEERTCTACNKVMTGKEPYDTHMAGKAHKKKLQQLEKEGTTVAA